MLERSVILASKAPCNIMLTDVRHGQHQATAEAVAGLLDTSTHRWFSTKNNSGLYYAKIEKSILNKDTTHAPSYQHKYFKKKKGLGFGGADNLFKRNFIQQGPPKALQMSITHPIIWYLREAVFPSSLVKVMPTHMPLFGSLCLI